VCLCERGESLATGQRRCSIGGRHGHGRERERGGRSCPCAHGPGGRVVRWRHEHDNGRGSMDIACVWPAGSYGLWNSRSACELASTPRRIGRQLACSNGRLARRWHMECLQIAAGGGGAATHVSRSGGHANDSSNSLSMRTTVRSLNDVQLP
jgi:hypothetical protein